VTRLKNVGYKAPNRNPKLSMEENTMTTESFLSSVADELTVALYGRVLEDVSFSAGAGRAKGAPPAIAYTENSPVSLVRVYGTKLLGRCITLPVPILLILPNSAERDSSGCSQFPASDYKMWVFKPDEPLVRVSTKVGTAAELVSAFGDTFDVHFHDVSISGTVISGKLRAHIVVFGVTVVDRDDSFSYDFGPRPCIPLFDWGVVSINVCFDVGARKICGTAKYGIDLPWPIGHVGGSIDIACVQV